MKIYLSECVLSYQISFSIRLLDQNCRSGFIKLKFQRKNLNYFFTNPGCGIGREIAWSRIFLGKNRSGSYFLDLAEWGVGVVFLDILESELELKTLNRWSRKKFFQLHKP